MTDPHPRRVRRIVCGLGNPGPEYVGTRHNVGFDTLERLALHEGLLFEGPQSLPDFPEAAAARRFRVARAHDPDVLLVKPETFMNRSGEVVQPLLAWAGLAPEDLLVVYDDMDLELGVLRLRPFGGAGGQKGMRSIIQCLESDRFPRLRIGIGRPPTAAARHVLAKFPERDREEIGVSMAEAIDAILFWLREGDIEACMTRFHSRWNQGS